MGKLHTPLLALTLSLPLVALAQDYQAPRHASGQPDFSGVWTNDTITPIERPATMSDREFLSDDEIQAMEQRIADRREFADNNIVVEAGGNVGPATSSAW